MTAQREIDDLDRSLAEDGDDVYLQRYFAPTIMFEVKCRAFVRPYMTSSSGQKLAGNVTQGESKVIMSPTQINAVGWPGPDGNSDPDDKRIPRKTSDWIVVNGSKRAVEHGFGIYMGNTLIRIEVRLKAPS